MDTCNAVETRLKFTTNGASFLAIMSAVSSIVKECTFRADSDGIAIRIMDKGGKTMLDVMWKSDSFASYECNEPTIFAVDTRETRRAIKGMEKNDSVSVSITDSALLFKTDGGMSGSLRQIHGGMRLPLPKMQQHAMVELSTETFRDMMRGIKRTNGFLHISASNKAGPAVVFLVNKGTGMYYAQKNVPLLASRIIGDHGCIYRLDHLGPVTKAMMAVANRCRIEFSDLATARIDYVAPDIGRIHLYVAQYSE